MMPTLFAQIPDPAQVINRATGISWEAGMVASIMVVFLSVIIYMIKRLNDQMEKERDVHKLREERMAKRIDSLEDELHKLQTDHQSQMIAIVKEVTACILRSVEGQTEVTSALRSLAEIMNGVNGDIRELCQLIKCSPCLVAGMHREGYHVVDQDGNKVDVSQMIERKPG